MLKIPSDLELYMGLVGNWEIRGAEERVCFGATFQI